MPLIRFPQPGHRSVASPRAPWLMVAPMPGRATAGEPGPRCSGRAFRMAVTTHATCGAWVAVHGPLTLSTVRTAERILTGLVRDGRPLLGVVLCPCVHLSEAGLETLERSALKARQAGGTLVVHAASPEVRGMLGVPVGGCPAPSGRASRGLRIVRTGSDRV